MTISHVWPFRKITPGIRVFSRAFLEKINLSCQQRSHERLCPFCLAKQCVAIHIKQFAPMALPSMRLRSVNRDRSRRPGARTRNETDALAFASKSSPNVAYCFLVPRATVCCRKRSRYKHARMIGESHDRWSSTANQNDSSERLRGHPT